MALHWLHYFPSSIRILPSADIISSANGIFQYFFFSLFPPFFFFFYFFLFCPWKMYRLVVFTAFCTLLRSTLTRISTRGTQKHRRQHERIEAHTTIRYDAESTECAITSPTKRRWKIFYCHFMGMEYLCGDDFILLLLLLLCVRESSCVPIVLCASNYVCARGERKCRIIGRMNKRKKKK